MTKSEAIALFGTSGADLARALGLTRGRISQLPEELPQEVVDRINGAALRLGIAPKVSGQEQGAAA